MSNNDEFTCEEQEDGRWFVLRNGTFFIACPSERVAKDAIEFLRKDAEKDDGS